MIELTAREAAELDDLANRFNTVGVEQVGDCLILEAGESVEAIQRGEIQAGATIRREG